MAALSAAVNASWDVIEDFGALYIIRPLILFTGFLQFFLNLPSTFNYTFLFQV